MYVHVHTYVHHPVSCHLIPTACRTNPPPPPASEPSLVDRAKMDSEVGTLSDFGQCLQAGIRFGYQSIYVYLWTNMVKYLHFFSSHNLFLLSSPLPSPPPVPVADGSPRGE